MGKHFETATIGHKNNKELIEKHGNPVLFTTEMVAIGGFFGIGNPEPTKVVYFSDGHREVCPRYCGNTVEEFIEIAEESSSWNLEDEWEFQMEHGFPGFSYEPVSKEIFKKYHAQDKGWHYFKKELGL